jgi:soluble cytochrome b562
MMRNKSNKTKAAKKSRRAKASKKVSPAKKRIQAVHQHIIPKIEDSARVQESIHNYHQGKTKGFASVDEIWEFAESDR